MVWATAFAAVFALTGATTDGLARAFTEPPRDARPQVWWHWMDGNISKEGITADLESMAAAGLGGAHVFDVTGARVPRGPVRFGTPQWDEMFVHAHREARRLGLALTLANCSGYSSSGGPWVKPAESMKFVEWTETKVVGGRTFRGRIPRFADDHGFSRDIAVFAVRKPSGESHLADLPGFQAKTNRADRLEVFEFTLPRKAKASAISLVTETPVIWSKTIDLKVEARDAGGVYRPVLSRALPFCNGGSIIGTPRNLRFPATESDAWRVTVSFKQSYRKECRVKSIDLGTFVRLGNLAEKTLRAPSSRGLSPEPRCPADLLVRREDVVFLDGRLKGDELKWDVPAGEWTVYRMVEASNGFGCLPATPGGSGLEIDKFDRRALEKHVAAFLGRMARLCEIDPASDPAKRSGFVTALIDSYEPGGQNWGANFAAEFRRRRGYDVVSPLLPALAGRVVASAAETDRFLQDFRKTCAELFRENYADAFTDCVQALGLQSAIEPYGEAPAPNFTFATNCDLPMAEFWLKPGQVYVPPTVVGVAEMARAHGHRIVQSESFTSKPADDDWKQPISIYKAQGDKVYAAGVNRVVYHRFAHQPWVDPRKRPGMTMGYWGTHFERTQTYWPYVGDWISYQSRCQALLQAGEFASSDPAADPCWMRRRYEDGSEGWFVATASNVPTRVEFDLGNVGPSLAGSVPELWDPETGDRREARSWRRTASGGIAVTLDFDEQDSVFVMLRPKGSPRAAKAPRERKPVGTVDLGGAWSVSFDPASGGPGEVSFDRLVSWPEREEDGIRHYSGTAIYRKSVALPPRAKGSRLVLELGEVRELARVTANGRTLPVLWKKPFRVDVTDAVGRSNRFELAIEVVNLWPNRMIGDAALPPEKRLTFSVYQPWKADSPLLPSGLLGPVKLSVMK